MAELLNEGDPVLIDFIYMLSVIFVVSNVLFMNLVELIKGPI